MENSNKGFASFKGGNKSNNENELNPEMSSKLKSPGKSHLPTKNFMSPTVSAAIKASVPRKKILGERKATLDTVEQTSLQRSSSFGSTSVKSHAVDSDDVVEKDLVGKPCLQPYDPVKNYLSTRPKFLRYNPNRRRKISNLQENDEDGVKISTYFDDGNGMPSSDLQLGLGSPFSLDSCSHQESAEEAEDVNLEEEEDGNGEDDEEETVEFGDEDRCSIKGFFKILFVVIAVILTTQAICLMNSPSPSQTLESIWGINHHVYGLNFSEVGYSPIRDLDLLVGRFKEGDAYGHSGRLDMSETIEESVVVQDAKTDDYVQQDEVEDGDSNVTQDEPSQEHDFDYVEAETVHDFNQVGLAEEDDSIADETNPQLTNDSGFEMANDMEEEVDDIKANEVLIKSTSFDPTIAVLIGHLLILTSVSVIYCSKCKKSSASVTTPVEKEEFKDVEPSTNPESMIQQKEEVTTSLQVDVSKVHIPSVELLGEFVFGEELTTSNISAENHSSNSLIIQTTADSFSQTKYSSYMELSTGDSHTVKKQGRKNAGVVTPSPVRRSSRLKTRSVMSP